MCPVENIKQLVFYYLKLSLTNLLDLLTTNTETKAVKV